MRATRRMMIGILTVGLCGWANGTHHARAQTMLPSDIFLTPDTGTGPFGGFVGGDGGGGYDWSIGNRPPYGPVREDLVFSTNTGVYTNPADWVERMCITKDGRIGIGTTTPGMRFHLIGDDGKALGFEDNALAMVMLTWDGSQYHNLFLKTTTNNNNLSIDTNGNVGIGTDNPVGKLDVNGSIYQRGSLLHADYVFEPEYRLESIAEHAEFMWENRHLAAIPAATSDEEGREIIEVGAHRRGIVEELEKAHIYIAQLNQRIQKLEGRLAALEAGGNAGQ